MCNKPLIPLLLLLAIAFSSSAQQPVSTATSADTARMIVERYLNALNYDSLPSNSVLYIESSIYDFENRSDTLFMKRWFMPPHCFRTELWYHKQLQIGYRTDGQSISRMYDTVKHAWTDIDLASYYDFGGSYDFHGPLYYWRSNGTEMHYVGEREVGGVKVYQVHVETPRMYSRDYLFEQKDGLLFFIIEHPQTFGDEKLRGEHVEWRAFTDYVHVGKCLMPYTESYKHNGQVTVIDHRYTIMKKDKRIFEKD